MSWIFWLAVCVWSPAIVANICMVILGRRMGILLAEKSIPVERCTFKFLSHEWWYWPRYRYMDLCNYHAFIHSELRDGYPELVLDYELAGRISVILALPCVPTGLYFMLYIANALNLPGR